MRVVDRVHDTGALRVHLELGAVAHQRARRAVVQQADLCGGGGGIWGGVGGRSQVKTKSESGASNFGHVNV